MPPSPMAAFAALTDADADSVIDITGQPALSLPARLAAPPVTPVPHYASYQTYYSRATQLGDFYEVPLGLHRSEVTWLNKFIAPVHAFMQLEVAREATVRLFVAVANELEQQAKEAGANLLKRVKELNEEVPKQIYSYYNYRYVSRNAAGHKVGAAIFLTIFMHCENAVRERYAFKLLDADVYYSEENDPEGLFEHYFGDAVRALLPALAQALPPPTMELEQTLNQLDQARWQPCFAHLLTLLPTDAPGFVAGVYALGHENARNPAVSLLYLEALRQLSERADEPLIREAILGLYLHYLHYGSRKYNFRPKPLLKRLQKKLFLRPEHQERFEALSEQLLTQNDLPQALEQLPAIFYQERRKIALDPAAVQAAHARHAGTVELLNEYLQDAPEVAPTPRTPPATAAGKAPALPKKTKAKAAASPKKAAAQAPPAPLAPPANRAAGVAGLELSAVQRSLLQLFAAHQLALPQARVEAFAKSHGALRNQLIDGLNDACFELLDDVLVEESDDGYTIYEPYYQRVMA